ncbi:MAG: Low-affinity putrescine importer PlaP [Bacteroidetes bacterium ADurb.Bin139]|nr:MAG: Low-affinity putrescine importer PlaP [Bacteroidetes bacterium ADurb.Bin139]
MAGLGIAGSALPLETVITIINFGALIGFIMVNLSVIMHYYVKLKRRGFSNVVKFLVLPGLGLITCTILLYNLTAEAKLVGIVWLTIGVIYAALTTNFFRKTPRSLTMLEDMNGEG